MNDEQRALLSKSEQLLRAAELLVAQGFADPACSEAYYAMFNAAKAALISKQLYRSRHSAVLAAFGQHFAKPGLVSPDLHRWLIDAERDRLVADYTTRGTAAELAEAHIAHAAAFITEIKSLLATD